MNTNQYIPADHFDLIKRRMKPSDAAIVDLLRLTGFRVSDLLRVRNYQIDKVYISLYEQKTGKIRTIPTSQAIRDAVRKYRRATFQEDPQNVLAYLFRSERGRKKDKRHLSRTTIYRRFELACYMAGLGDKGYSIHSLRKCYAVDLYERTGSLLEVQRDLGHESLATTCLYVFGSRATL